VASGVDDDVKDYGALRGEYLRHLSVDELTGLLPTRGWNGNKLDDKRDKENGMPVTKPLRDLLWPPVWCDGDSCAINHFEVTSTCRLLVRLALRNLRIRVTRPKWQTHLGANSIQA
jgi:hypothetical protein